MKVKCCVLFQWFFLFSWTLSILNTNNPPVFTSTLLNWVHKNRKSAATSAYGPVQSRKIKNSPGKKTPDGWSGHLKPESCGLCVCYFYDTPHSLLAHTHWWDLLSAPGSFFSLEGKWQRQRFWLRRFVIIGFWRVIVGSSAWEENCEDLYFQRGWNTGWK